jgi:hypothetical protein
MFVDVFSPVVKNKFRVYSSLFRPSGSDHEVKCCWVCSKNTQRYISGNIYIYIYIDEIITKWQNQDIAGIKLSKNRQLSTLLFADDQVIIRDTEDNLQKAAYKLNQIITEYGLTISVQKTKSMAF